MSRSSKQFLLLALALVLPLSAFAGKKVPKTAKTVKPPDPIEEYLAQTAYVAKTEDTPERGSLYTANGLLADPYADVRAHRVGDTISVQILESTTIAQSGNVDTSRAFSHSSAVTGVGGQTPSFLNPLLALNSSSKLSGAGTTSSQSALNTTLTALVVGLLPNGLLVVEANRQIMANQQHEDVVLRGVVRQADISSNNTILSNQLFALQLEVKGKGVISDTVREPNPVIRVLMHLFSF